MTVSTQIVIQGNNLDVLPKIPDASIDAIVTDPPYGLAFMGKSWDKTLPDPRTWTEALRVLKPGGHALIFGAPRLYHRLACAVEDAGFEVRDVLMWMFGSGFPKSLDVSKEMDKRAGIWRGRAGESIGRTGEAKGEEYIRTDKGDPVTPEAAAWAGWGTALKPAYEPILLVRKPLIGTVAQNVLTHGTGGINVDACRVATDDTLVRPPIARDDNQVLGSGLGVGRQAEPPGRWPANVILDEEAGAILGEQARFFYCPKASRSEREAGLTPENMLCSCKPEELEAWASEDRNQPTISTKALCPRGGTCGSTEAGGTSWPTDGSGNSTTDRSLTDSRSTTTTKTSLTTGSRTSDSSPPKSTNGSTPVVSCETGCGSSPAGCAGCSSLSESPIGISARRGGLLTEGVALATSRSSSEISNVAICLACSRRRTEPGVGEIAGRDPESAGAQNPRAGTGRKSGGRWNAHSTVKPLDLMAWCVKLITPPGGVVLDPFAGSGSTLAACASLGVSCLGIELDPEYVAIGNARIAHWSKKG